MDILMVFHDLAQVPTHTATLLHHRGSLGLECPICLWGWETPLPLITAPPPNGWPFFPGMMHDGLGSAGSKSTEVHWVMVDGVVGPLSPPCVTVSVLFDKCLCL